MSRKVAGIQKKYAKNIKIDSIRSLRQQAKINNAVKVKAGKGKAIEGDNTASKRAASREYTHARRKYSATTIYKYQVPGSQLV